MTLLESSLSRFVSTPEPRATRPTQEQAEAAVRTLIAWAGDDPDREGVLETPNRVARAYGEFFAGYQQVPEVILSKTFEDVAGYDEAVTVRDISFESFCEHHMVPFIGKAHISYLPDQRVVGLSKLGRLVDCFARRMQIQEKLTSQIAQAIDSILRPRGVAVVVEAEHQCMTTRGVRKHGSSTVTNCMLGQFRDSATARREFFEAIRS